MSFKKNILVTGANGQVGMEFRALAEKFNFFNFIFTDKSTLPVTDSTLLKRFFEEHPIDVCINCAAYTAVDKAETEKELALDVNANGAANLAEVCNSHECMLIHISTDYVFNGKAKQPYSETDATDPVNYYGFTKREGEIKIHEKNDMAIIIRTSWVYSSYGKNFVKTMLRLMGEKDSVGVVQDQWGCPTYAADLAEAILRIIEADDFVAGVFHYCNQGIINWFEFAEEIKKLSGKSCLVNPISTSDFPTPAARPAYSALDTSRFFQTFGIPIPHWKDSLAACLKRME